MFYLEDGREHFFQWDVNRRLVINDNTIDQVHFCNRTDDCSLVVETYEENGLLMADVPNILLQDKWDIKIYLYANGEYTKQCGTFKVIARTKPADYVYTETEALKWDTLEAEIKADVEANNKTIREEVRTALTDVSNSLKGTANGRGAIRMDDISPISHNIEITTKCKNLLASPFGELNVENGKTYTLSIALKEDISYGTTYGLAWYDANGNWMNHQLAGSDGLSSSSHTFTVGADGCYGYYIFNMDFTEDMFEYVQLEEGIVATAYMPYVEDLNNVNLISYGKNLCDMTKAYARDKAGETIEVIDKDTIRWTGAYWFFLPVYIPAGATFRISMGGFEVESGTCKGFIKWYMEYEDGTKSEGFQNVYTATAEKNVKCICIYKNPAAGAATVVIKGYQIEIGDTKTEYERYKEPVEGVNIVYPTTTIVADTPGAAIEATYNRDLNKAFAELQNALVSLGANI